MILENVIERLEILKKDLDFIKECLWLLWTRKENKRTWKTANGRRFLSWPKKSFGCRKTN